MRATEIVWLAFAGLLVVSSPLSAQSGAVVGLGLTPAADWTELTIRTEGAVSAKSFQLDSPARVVVDVSGARHALPQTDYSALDRGGVRGIRTSQFDGRTVRIVVDLVRAAEHKVEEDEGWIRVSVRGAADFSRWETGSASTEAPAPSPIVTVEPTASPPTAAAPTTPTAIIAESTTTPLVATAQLTAAPIPSPPAADTTNTSPFPSLAAVEAQRSASDPAPVVSALPDTIVVTALVTQLAGTTVYIDQGQGAGLMEGDTIALLSSPVDNTLLHVISSSSSRAVLAFLSSPVPLTRGDRIRLEPRSRALGLTDDNPLDQVSAGAAGDDVATDEDNRPEVNGRISFDLNALQSTTTFEGAASGQGRTFVTPTTRLNASATHLPGGLRIDVNARGSYRHTSGGQVPSTTSIRFYDFSATKTFEGSKPVRVQFGRFYNPYESFSGYWDGGLVRLGSRDNGIGAALGYRPDYSNEGFSSDLPKLTVFADIRRVVEDGGFKSDVSFHRVTPLRDVGTHTFLGWASRAWWNDFQWSHEVQVDRSAETGEWILTDFQAYASTALRERLRVYGRYSRRQPFDFWDRERQLAYRRDGLGGGLNWSWNTGSASADVGVRNADEGPTTTTYSSSVQLSRIRGSRLGLTTWASYWSNDDSDGMSFSPSVTRPFGKSYGRLGYRFYNSESVFHSLTSHSLIGSLTAPIGPGLRLSLQGQASWGGNLQSFGLYTGLWKSF